MFFRIFHGNWRGPGHKEDKTIFANIGVEFRRYLHHFKGARLHVFMCIVLHMNEEGISGPSYDLIAEETGYSRGAVSKALAELCDETAIDGHPVLVRWRDRDDKGKYVGANQYKIFPTDDELHSLENPPVDKPTVGETRLEEEPSLKEKPEEKKKTSPKGEAPPPKKPAIASLSSHPAIKAFREAAARFPAKSWWQDVARIVGNDDVSIQKWGQVVKEWVGKGFNPVNVKGMLDVFENGWEGEEKPPAKKYDISDYADPPAPEPPPPPKPGEDVWLAVREDLQRQLPPETFNTWLRDCTFAGKDGHHYNLNSDNKYAVEWLRHRLVDVMNKTLRLHTGNEADEFRIVMPGLAIAETAAAAYNESHGIEKAPAKPGEPDARLGTPAPTTAGHNRPRPKERIA